MKVTVGIFQETEQYYKELTDAYRIPAAALNICLNGIPVYEAYAGFADHDRRHAVQKDTLFWVYSMTKLYTVTAVMQLAESGQLNLSDPVSNYLPEYNRMFVKDARSIRPAQTVLTLRHLLMMTGGLNYDLNCESIVNTTARGDASTMQVIKALAGELLEFDPGNGYKYSLCHDVLAGVIEAAADMPYQDYLRTYLFEPLGAADIGCFMNEEHRKRTAEQYRCCNGGIYPAGKDNLLSVSPQYASGGAGLFANLTDYSLLPAALSCGGITRAGKRILTEESIHQICETTLDRSLIPMFHKAFASHDLTGYSYGLGVRVRKADTGDSPIGEFGWDGAAGSYVLVDPVNRLAVTFMMSVKDYAAAYSTIHPTLRKKVYYDMKNSGHCRRQACLHFGT